MTRHPVPRQIHQSAVNAANMANRAALGLNGWTTWESLMQAEVAITRAHDELKAMRPFIRQLKADMRAAAKMEVA
jgi:hypothetical protein